MVKFSPLLVSDSEIFRGLFSYLTHFLILIHSAQSQINTTQRLISRIFQIWNLLSRSRLKLELHRPPNQRKFFNVNKKWRVSIGAFPYNFTQPFTTQLCSFLICWNLRVGSSKEALKQVSHKRAPDLDWFSAYSLFGPLCSVSVFKFCLHPGARAYISVTHARIWLSISA